MSNLIHTILTNCMSSKNINNINNNYNYGINKTKTIYTT